MDGDRFDAITKAFVGVPRRRVLGLLLAAPLALRARFVVAATCTLRANGERCTTSGQCCSGLCKKKRGTNKKFCRRASNQSLCSIEQNHCSSDVTDCGLGSTTCRCYVTLRGASFCGEEVPYCPDGGCDDNQTCQAEWAADAVCIQCPNCGPERNFRGCVRPCSAPV